MNALEVRKRFVRQLTLTAVCLALNVGLGKVSNIVGLPFTMDTVGTILGASILPWYYVLLVAALSSIVSSVLINPIFIYYIGTQVVIGLVALILVKFNTFKKLYQAILSGLVIGIVSAVVSAPVTALVFGGISVPSISFLNVLFLSSGKSLWQSVISGALIVESIDKIGASIVVCYTLRRLIIKK